ncbi:carbohydrate ABC transporter substrate-binding protein (CUT1 family) [Microterricola gilva]|uniref:Carbohydrate ABC transporter substrate-binding protein (CUT1 family) n=1 Tax=Microterricola gilva TaxID=393267 RepID=A0A4Q8AIU8_9MICO|nr:extracellular solute-binding protein [Microterricola gilva]RZU64258.1 carbohydrate ABC transporter substrate-binding protein (CUT1 family) [Microterricola gilva]
MKRRYAGLALATAAALVLAGCSATTGNEGGSADGQDITLWLMGGDTPDTLRDYLKTEYKDATGGTLTIEEQGWGDALAKLTTALPDAENTPDVVEIGNTWSPTFTNVGAFSDVSDMVEELGGDKLIQSFVEVGAVDGANYALPYYFGSRYNFYRKDIWAAAGKTVPTTLAEFDETVKSLRTDSQSGFYIGGSDWRNAISWIFANGGELAEKDGDKWVSTLSSANTQKGIAQFAELFKGASLAPSTEFDSTPWVNINNNEATGVPEAATIIAPGWAHWSIGDLAADPDDATKTVATWNDDVFGTFVLPGVDGGAAPVFAGGSNIAISAASKNQEGSRELLKIVFSPEYQTLLGENGLGPANLDYASALGEDQFAAALIESAASSKLTPAAPGWAAVEGAALLEEFFGKVTAGGDIKALSAEYDEKITALLN